MKPDYFCHKSVGTLKYDPGVGTKYEEPWWLILQCDPGIRDYYCWLLAKQGCRVQKNALWGSHVSVIKGEEPPSQRLWGHDFGPIEFWYTNEIRRDNDLHAWLDVWSEQLAGIRTQFGFTGPLKMSYHLTLGRDC